MDVDDPITHFFHFFILGEQGKSALFRLFFPGIIIPKSSLKRKIEKLIFIGFPVSAPFYSGSLAIV